LPDQLIDVDVPGNAQFDIGSEVGVRFPDPAGVLVPAATSPAASSQEPAS
jgi:2-aminoethylphosphonate transport system ATP-binding protein